MKIAITAEGPELTSRVDSRFGRAKYFLLVDTDTGQCTAHDNAQNAQAVQGAGVQAGQTVVNLGAAVLLTGNVGPKAFDVLHAGGVKVYPGAKGTAQEALQAFQAGTLQMADQPNVEGHWT